MGLDKLASVGIITSGDEDVDEEWGLVRTSTLGMVHHVNTRNIPVIRRSSGDLSAANNREQSYIQSSLGSLLYSSTSAPPTSTSLWWFAYAPLPHLEESLQKGQHFAHCTANFILRYRFKAPKEAQSVIPAL